jgi:hypothetical protein
MKRKLFRSPKPEEMAYELKKPPAKVRDLLYLHVPGYSEPTAEEIGRSNEKLWKTINMGLDLPNNNELLAAGIRKIEVAGMDEDILYSNYHRYKESFNRADFIKSKIYMREFPEMAPKIIQSREDDIQYITIEWGYELTQLLPELSRTDPETGHNMYGPHYTVSFPLMKDESPEVDLDDESYGVEILRD